MSIKRRRLGLPTKWFFFLFLSWGEVEADGICTLTVSWIPMMVSVRVVSKYIIQSDSDASKSHPACVGMIPMADVARYPVCGFALPDFVRR